MLRRLGWALLPLLVAGCVTSPEQAPIEAQPKTLPVRNFTSFSESLRCMDRLFANFGVRDIIITSQGIPDETAQVRAGTKDMLISAISRMSVRSGAFRFVDFDQTEIDINALQSLVGFTEDFLVPNYYIRGAITQLDEGVLRESISAGVAIPEAELGVSGDQIVSVISVDMNVGDLLTRQILAGMSASNSIAVTRQGRAGDLGGTIGKAGLVFNITLDRSEGVHQAVRTLIELSTIETLGKLAQVPYWRCLAIEQTNPAVVAEARAWFEDMTEKERIAFAQRALQGAGYYDGPLTAEADSATRGAVARYQADNGLLADGRVNFDLYASLIHQDLALGREPAELRRQVKQAAASGVRPNPLRLTLSTPEGAEPTYRLEETLEMTVVASQDAYLYCYYGDGQDLVARIYPNPFQPDPYVRAGQTVRIPGEEAGFDVVFETPGAAEEIVCLASPKELGLLLPPDLKTEALTPMPAGSLDEVAGAFRELDASTLAEARLPIRVVN